MYDKMRVLQVGHGHGYYNINIILCICAYYYVGSGRDGGCDCAAIDCGDGRAEEEI